MNLLDYIKAKNKYREQENKTLENSQSEMWIGSKKIDRNFKSSILQELSEKFGISKKTLFVEINHIENVLNYYTQLFEKAKLKAEWIKAQRKS